MLSLISDFALAKIDPYQLPPNRAKDGDEIRGEVSQLSWLEHSHALGLASSQSGCSLLCIRSRGYYIDRDRMGCGSRFLTVHSVLLAPSTKNVSISQPISLT